MNVEVIQALDRVELSERIDDFLRKKIEPSPGSPGASPVVKFISQSEGPHEIAASGTARGPVKQVITVVILWDCPQQ